MERDSICLNILGLAFPSCGLGVIVPISVAAKPKAIIELTIVAFLSKPAAKPTGLINGIPKISCFSFVLIMKFLFTI